MTRATREIVTIPGIGGSIEINQINLAQPIGYGQLKYAGLHLEVSNWAMDHERINVDVTHSGSNGCILRELVALDFFCVLSIPWNGVFAALRDKASYGFMETLLGGSVANHHVVSGKFNLGDPSHYWDLNLPAAYYYAPKMKLERTRTMTVNNGRDIVRLEVTVSGTSLLRGYTATSAAGADEVQRFGGDDNEFK